MYHIHVYFNSDQTHVAESVRSKLITKKIPLLNVSPLVTHPVGPHPKPMFEIHAENNQKEGIKHFLIDQGEGLGALIHPVSNNELKAHTVDAEWIGPPLPLDLEFLKNLL